MFGLPSNNFPGFSSPARFYGGAFLLHHLLIHRKEPGGNNNNVFLFVGSSDLPS